MLLNRPSLGRCVLNIVVMVAVASIACVAGVRPAIAQCGASVLNRYGGETTAVEAFSASLLLVAHGTTLDLVSVANPAAPSYLTLGISRIALDAPAVKISMTSGATRAFVLEANGEIVVVNVTSISLFRADTIQGDYTDIVADGNRVLAVEFPANVHNGGGQGRMRVLDASVTPASYGAVVSPTNSGYRYDKIVKTGSAAWIGFHLDATPVLGVDGIDMTNPALPARIATSLNTSTTGGNTTVTALAASGSRLYVAFANNSTMIEDWMRVVDLTTPATPSWRPAVDLNSRAQDISVTGTQVHVAVGSAGVSVWDAANASAMAWQGTYVIQAGSARDVFAVSGTDYVAAAGSGLELLNTTNPAAMSVRSLLDELPSRAVVVRQANTITVTLDTDWNFLRLFDYTQPAGSQSRGIAFTNSGDELLEIAVLPGGRYACVTGSSSTFRVIDINNAASPTVLATLNMGTSVRMLSVFGSKAYTWDENSTLKVIDLINPSNPIVRSSTMYGGTAGNYTAITSWTNTVALGTNALGVWIIDVANAAAPQIRSIWNPGNSYSVGALCRGPSNLFVGATTGTGATLRSRLETLDTSNLNVPTLAWGFDNPVGGNPPRIDALMYMANATNHFLVATRAAGVFVPVKATLTFFDLANAQVPVPIGTLDAWDIRNGGPVANADGTRLLAGGNEAGVYEIAAPTQWAPGFVVQPVDRSACLGGSVLFALGFPAVSANPSTGVTFRWYRNGLPLSDGPTGWGSTISGSTGFMTISGLHPQDASGAAYTCLATNSCGSTFSTAVHVLMCPPDFNCSGTLTVQDIFDFLSAWFAGTSTANYNGVNGLGVQDIFDFLSAWFAGCT